MIFFSRGDVYTMQEKIVIYGLGRAYEKKKESIEKHYGKTAIVAHCDSNAEKVRQYEKGILPRELAEHIGEYDKVVITSYDILGIYNDLVDKLNIPTDKIECFLYEELPYKDAEITFYGEHLEDAVLFMLLKQMGQDFQKIRYLEIGTNNPVFGNNTFSLYKQGARGILIDPLPAVAFWANRIRAEDSFMSVAVKDIAKPGEKVIFYECNDPGLSSLLKTHYLKWDNMKLTKELEVPVLGINDILKSLDFIPDILLVDAEGFDRKIVEAIDYTKYKPLIVVVEICDMEHDEYKEFLDFMKRNGYIWYTTVADVNAIFIRKE